MIDSRREGGGCPQVSCSGSERQRVAQYTLPALKRKCRTQFLVVRQTAESASALVGHADGMSQI